MDFFSVIKFVAKKALIQPSTFRPSDTEVKRGFWKAGIPPDVQNSESRYFSGNKPLCPCFSLQPSGRGVSVIDAHAFHNILC